MSRSDGDDHRNAGRRPGGAGRCADRRQATARQDAARRDGSAVAFRGYRPDFEQARAAVESVSVLFTLHDGDAAAYAETERAGRQVPSGWRMAGARFEVAWPADPERQGLVRSHFGARRMAFNWGLALVKADLDARKDNPGRKSVGWSAGELRKAWNQAKDTVAPWWRANSKETYASGLADLARALENWKTGKDGTRKGRRPGSRSSSPRAGTRAGSGLPPAPCGWRMTGAPSPCPSSAPCSPRKTPVGCNGIWPPGTRASST